MLSHLSVSSPPHFLYPILVSWLLRLKLTRNYKKMSQNGTNGANGSEKAAMDFSNFPQPPKFDDKKEEREYLKGRLAAAFRIFAKFGFDEGVAGHITFRVRFLQEMTDTHRGPNVNNKGRIQLNQIHSGSIHLVFLLA